MKQQIVCIHGGDVFDTYEDYLDYLKNYNFDFEKLTGKKDWKENLAGDLEEGYEILSPKMPCKQNAKYLEWKIFFERMLPLINNEVILIGNSLGGIFLVKYLAENIFPLKIKSLYLVAAPFDKENTEESLSDFKSPDFLEKLKSQVNKIFIYHSKDDPIVNFSASDKYVKLLPDAKRMIFENKGHFFQEHFPELVENIKSDL